MADRVGVDGGAVKKPASEKLYRYKDLEEMGIASHTTIFRWVRKQMFPAPIIVDGRPAWRPRDVENWLKHQRLK